MKFCRAGKIQRHFLPSQEIFSSLYERFFISAINHWYSGILPTCLEKILSSPGKVPPFHGRDFLHLREKFLPLDDRFFSICEIFFLFKWRILSSLRRIPFSTWTFPSPPEWLPLSVKDSYIFIKDSFRIKTDSSPPLKDSISLWNLSSKLRKTFLSNQKLCMKDSFSPNYFEKSLRGTFWYCSSLCRRRRLDFITLQEERIEPPPPPASPSPFPAFPPPSQRPPSLHPPLPHMFDLLPFSNPCQTCKEGKSKSKQGTYYFLYERKEKHFRLISPFCFCNFVSSAGRNFLKAALRAL
jgi:hypothetical protein